MAAAIAVAASGCEKWMERHDPASVDATTYWKNRDALEQYTNGFLESYTPGEGTIAYSYDSYSDIIQARNQNDFLQTAWTSSQQGSWGKDDWNFIYNIEYFLDNFRNVPGLSEEVYDHYEGVARFWRAWHYFTKVQLFGAVPYYDYVIEPDDEGLYKARDSREYVCEKILEDLDFAAEHVSTDSQYLKVSKINRYVALFVKAKFCLWEGTFRKYHSVDRRRVWHGRRSTPRRRSSCAQPATPARSLWRRAPSRWPRASRRPTANRYTAACSSTRRSIIRRCCGHASTTTDSTYGTT